MAEFAVRQRSFSSRFHSATSACRSASKRVSVMMIMLIAFLFAVASASGIQEESINMHNASCLAGMAFTNASLGLVHSLAHKIGGEFGVTHGLANAILLPYIIDFNRKFSDKYDLAEKRLGVKDIAETVRKLNKKLNIPLTFKDCTEVDFSEDKFKKVLDRMSKNAHGDPCTLTNPGKPTVADVKMIYESAY